ncbi:TPA: DUF3800 domain-containing protein [Vibrio parahaemolyticus]|uniref:DUF3800 domain-containing protein n=2 Tax=Vibrio parahaemolyticus TaxID=670 RepID=UPI001122EB94|nr:DUF3800 domain-containing protein [Vibrio parahaemolyticus]TOJ14116.1 hypothetical protein CGI45_18530 [Vibrio parahaemolyticus]
MSVCFFLDESGDLGWTLDKPFGQGGSSQHLTIATISSDVESHRYIGRFMKKAKKKYGFSSKQEMKWIDLNDQQRLEFAEQAAQLVRMNDGLQCHAIVVAKRGVSHHLRNDKNLLYNYLIRMSLFDEIVKHPCVTLIPDPQGIAPNTGAPLHIYIQHLAYEHAARTGNNVTTVGFRQLDSSSSFGIQFADMLAGIIQQKYEGISEDYFNHFSEIIQIKKFFFPSAQKKLSSLA